MNKRQAALGKSFILNDSAKRTFVRFLYRAADGKDSPQSTDRIARTIRKVLISR